MKCSYFRISLFPDILDNITEHVWVGKLTLIDQVRQVSKLCFTHEIDGLSNHNLIL